MKISFKTTTGIGKVLQEQYSQGVEAGWLENKKYFETDFNKGFGRKTGGKTRIKGKISRLLNFDVVEALEKGGRRVFSKPSESYETKEFRAVLDILAMGKEIIKKGEVKLRNLASSIFVKPMIRGEYRKESQGWLVTKGFSRPTILTGQTLERISARLFSAPKKSIKEPKEVK